MASMENILDLNINCREGVLKVHTISTYLLQLSWFVYASPDCIFPIRAWFYAAPCSIIQQGGQLLPPEFTLGSQRSKLHKAPKLVKSSDDSIYHSHVRGVKLTCVLLTSIKPVQVTCIHYTPTTLKGIFYFWVREGERWIYLTENCIKPTVSPTAAG